MKWPFFKTSPPEPKSNKALFTPPRPPTNPVAYSLKKTQPVTHDVPAVTLEDQPTISVPLSSIQDQIPAGLFPARVLTDLATRSVDVPADRLLPQLAKGKVTLSVADLLELLPPEFAPANVANSVRQQMLVLPIDLIVAGIPSQAFATHGSAVVEDDTFDVPALFDEALLTTTSQTTLAPAEPTADQDADLPTRVTPGQDEVPDDEPIFFEAAKAGPGETQAIVFPGYAPGTAPVEPEPSPEPAATPAPAPVRTAATETRVAPAAPVPAGVPTTINIRVRTLVTNMPASVFVCQAPELWQHVNPDQTVALPVAPILALLPSGRATLPLATVAQALPANILRSPLPMVENPNVALPLSEVIPQLPASVFQPTGTTSDDFEQEEVDGEMSAVFREREAAAPLPEAMLTETIPAAPAPATEAAEAELPELEAEIFVEREPAPAVEPVAETVATPAPEPEPVIEPEPALAPKPIAATVHVEQPLPPAPAPTVELSPVFEAAPEPVAAQTPLAPAPEPVLKPLPVEAEPVCEIPTAAPVAELPAPVVAAPTPAIEPPAPVVEPAAPVVEPPALVAVTIAPVVEPLATVVEPPAPVIAATVPVAETPVPVAEQPAPLAVELPAPVAAPPDSDELSALDARKFLINLNTCTLEDLTNIHGVGPALGARIIEYRTQHGPFNSIEQLREIPGIGRKTFRALAGPTRNLLNRALAVDHDRELTLQQIVHITSTIPGIQGAILTSADGLFLTGHLPPHLDEGRLSVFAPQLFKKVGRYAKELSVGEVHRMTMFTDEQPVSIFQAGDIYLIVIHDTLHFSKALLRRLTRISEGIARLCRQRAVV